LRRTEQAYAQSGGTHMRGRRLMEKRRATTDKQIVENSSPPLFCVKIGGERLRKKKKDYGNGAMMGYKNCSKGQADFSMRRIEA